MITCFGSFQLKGHLVLEQICCQVDSRYQRDLGGSAAIFKKIQNGGLGQSDWRWFMLRYSGRTDTSQVEVEEQPEKATI